VLKPWVWLTITVVAVFLAGSFVIDALLPTETRAAMLITLPTSTGNVVADYAITTWQIGVLVGGVLAGFRLARRQGD
jgi:hypothetical protein